MNKSLTKNKAGILFVDDEANILSALQRELHAWSKEMDIEIATAPSAVHALNILEARAADFDVVVSDLRMPGMLGSDFLLRVKERWPSIITLLLTGYSEVKEIAKAVKAGIHSCVIKPWEPDYLRNELANALETRRAREKNAEYAALMEDELRWAGEMQRTILKPILKTTEGIEFRVSYRPLPDLHCGGDYYDVINLAPDRFLVLLGDVAGHGVKGAFITGILKAIIFPEYVRNFLGKPFHPGDFLSWLNERMNFELRKTAEMIITFLAGVIDKGAMTLTYANAGHNHPFLVSGWIPRELPVAGSAIGFAAAVHYPEQTVDLAPGDVLLAFTDGLVEVGPAPALAPAALLGRVEFGSDFHKRLMEEALAAAGAGDFTDDLTIVTARVL